MKNKTNEGVASFGLPLPFQVLLLHSVCGISLLSALWVAHNIYFIDLISNPSQTLCLICVFEAPVVIFAYSLFRGYHSQCSYLKALTRGLLGLPIGAVANALGAIVLGAPFGMYFTRTASWSLLMSLLTFVPAAVVFGSSWTDWQRIFLHSKPIGYLDYMTCLPAHGAIIGAWLGAWPMPLDWERPWQDWPICVTYGAIGGYFLGMISSFVCSVLFFRRGQHAKGN